MKRKLLDEVLCRQPRGPLYHYTSSDGLTGIISKAEIWATHTQYLNDMREYLHAVGMVREQIRAMHAFGPASNHETLKEMEDSLDGVESINVCVCSFSEDRDSLSQWRAYGSGLSRFSIGFEGGFIAAASARERWFLAPCIYDEKSQRELVSALVQEVVEENNARKRSKGAEDFVPPGGNLIAYLHRYAPILKDSSFHEEKEWRLISRPLTCKSESFDYRAGHSMLIPYYKFPLADNKNASSLKLHEVVVGSTPHPNQSSKSVRGFLVRHSLSEVPVEVSKVPYRSW